MSKAQTEFPNDDNGTCSVSTIILHEVGRVHEEDEEATTEHEDCHQSSCKVGQPRTPKPSLVGFMDDSHH